MTFCSYSPVSNISNAWNKTYAGPNSQKLIKLTYLIQANGSPVFQKSIKLTDLIKANRGPV